MTTIRPIDAHSELSARAEGFGEPDPAQLAAAAFLARYGGRTLEAYRRDLRYFFQWATDRNLDVLAATRALC